MSLQLGVANAVATLTAVSQACKGAVRLWILHGLCLTANAAGLAYVPYCKVTIFAVLSRVCIDLSSEDNYIRVYILDFNLGIHAFSSACVVLYLQSPCDKFTSACPSCTANSDAHMCILVCFMLDQVLQHESHVVDSVTGQLGSSDTNVDERGSVCSAWFACSPWPPCQFSCSCAGT